MEQIENNFLRLFKIIDDNHDLCLILLSKNYSRNFLYKFSDKLRDSHVKGLMSIYKIDNFINANYLYAFLTSGCLGLIHI